MKYFFARRISSPLTACTCLCNCNKCKIVETRSIAIQCNHTDDEDEEFIDVITDDNVAVADTEVTVIAPVPVPVSIPIPPATILDNCKEYNFQHTSNNENTLPLELFMDCGESLNIVAGGIPVNNHKELEPLPDFIYNSTESENSDFDDDTASAITTSSNDEQEDELFTITPTYESIQGFRKVSNGYQCNKCERILSTISAFQMHSYSHKEHSKLCRFCGFIAETNRKLAFHERRHHHHHRRFSSHNNWQQQTLASKSTNTQQNRNNRMKKNYYCMKCNHKFPNGTKLRLHNELKHIEKTIGCTECKQKFVSNKRLHAHVRLYHIIQYKCPPCNLVLSKRGYDRHYKIRHSSNSHFIANTIHQNQIQTVFVCNLCNKKYVSESDLNLHCHAWHRRNKFL